MAAHEKAASSRAACTELRYASLVNVAPLTVATELDWALITSAARIGLAFAASWIERLSASGDCSVETSVIWPPLIVTATWTSPQRVDSTLPVYVPSLTVALPVPASVDALASAAPAVPFVGSSVDVVAGFSGSMAPSCHPTLRNPSD